MVSRGFVPSATRIPSPDMSFARLFEDRETGWQQRGQYAIWIGENAIDSPRFQLLERRDKRVAVIPSGVGSPVLHRIASGVPFTIQNLMGYWLSFDSDAIWLDVSSGRGQYALLAAGGAVGKPAHASVDCPCPNCGATLHHELIPIVPQRFNAFLDKAEAWVSEFNGDSRFRTCTACGSIHPPTYGLAHRDVGEMPAGS